MNNQRPLNAKQWYRIDGQTIFCVRYTETYQVEGISSIDMEGIKPQDYAAYVTHMYLGENKAPYRSVGEITCIPMPELIRLRFTSTAKIEEISTAEALRKEETEDEQR